MQVLLIDAYAPDDPDRGAVLTSIVTALTPRHELTHVALGELGWSPAMTAEERHAYHGDQPLCTDDTRDQAALVRATQALVFAYPTVAYTVPARLKGWLDRVLVPGVAFGFDDKGRVARGMTHIVRLGAVTTRPHGRLAMYRHRDGGHRTLLRTVWLNCAPTCRRTFVALSEGAPDRVPIERRLGRW